MLRISTYWKLIKQSLKGEAHDYTEGSIPLATALLAIPMILELSLESVFAIVDIYFVSHLGSEAIATVGLTESVITIVYSLAIGLSSGATAIVARRVGEKNNSSAAKAGVQSILIGLFASILVSIPGIIFAPEILELMGGSEEVVREGAIFTRIMIGCSFVIILLFLINGIFRGAGDAAMAMRSLWIASILNIILCPLFIELYGLKGAAMATVIGRGTGVIYQCYYLFGSKGLLKVKWSYFLPDRELIRNIISIAWPATLQFIIASGSWMVLARLVATTGGTDAVAGYQLAIRNVVFFILPAWGMSNAAATLVGQNLGAGKPDRAEKSVWIATRYNAVFMAFVMLLFLLIPETIIHLFNAEPEVEEYAIKALRIIGSGYIFYGIGMVMIQSLNGAGDTLTPTIINLLCFWFFQIPLAYLFSGYFEWGYEGVLAAVPIAETLIAVVAFLYFKGGKWKSIKV